MSHDFRLTVQTINCQASSRISLDERAVRARRRTVVIDRSNVILHDSPSPSSSPSATSLPTGLPHVSSAHVSSDVDRDTSVSPYTSSPSSIDGRLGNGQRVSFRHTPASSLFPTVFRTSTDPRLRQLRGNAVKPAGKQDQSHR